MAVDCEGKWNLGCLKNVATARAENEESPRSNTRRKQNKNFVFVSKKNKKISELRSSFPVRLPRRLVRQEIVAELRSTAAEQSKRCDNFPKHHGHCPNFRTNPARVTVHRPPALLLLLCLRGQVFHPKNEQLGKVLLSLKFFPISTRFSTRRVVNWSSLHTHTHERTASENRKSVFLLHLMRISLFSAEKRWVLVYSTFLLLLLLLTHQAGKFNKRRRRSEWKNFFLLLFFSSRGSTARFLGLRSWKMKT